MTKHEKERLMELVSDIAVYINERVEHGDGEWNRNCICFQNSEWIVEVDLIAKGRFEESRGDYWTPESIDLTSEWVEVDEMAVYRSIDSKTYEDVEPEEIEEFFTELKSEIEC